MKKKDETRYFVTAVASVPVYKSASKTEMYRMATKPGWGAVEWYSAADDYKNPVARDRSDKTQQLCCDEDTSASLYTKNGGYFGIFPYEEINVKEMPKQAACAAIIYSDSCGYSIWAEDFNQIHIFVTYDVNGLIDSYRVEYGEDAQPYDGETEIRFEDLYQQPEGDWKETYRAEIPGTVEYQHKQEAARIAETAGATWMDADQQEQFRRICNLIDKIKSGRDFYHIINKINNNYELDVINAAREYKKCFNSAQYEQPEEAGHMEELREFYRKYGDVTEMDEAPGAGTLVAVAAGMIERDTAADATPALAYTDDLGVARCGKCGTELLCNETGDMPDMCPECGRRLEYDSFIEPDGPDVDRYRTRADNQQEAGTAAEAASEGREAALGTPETMAGTDATEAAGGQQPPPQAGEINLGKLYAGTRLEATERDEGKQPGGP